MCWIFYVYIYIYTYIYFYALYVRDTKWKLSMTDGLSMETEDKLMWDGKFNHPK